MYDHARLFVRVTTALARSPGVSLHQLAQALRVHPHTIAQVVREHTGTSFSAWRASRRIAASCALLRTRPDLSIKEVSAAVGFASTSVFDRFLRRACGRSPSECRLASSPPITVRGDHHCSSRDGSKVNVLDIRSTDGGAQPAAAGATLESSTASS